MLLKVFTLSVSILKLVFLDQTTKVLLACLQEPSSSFAFRQLAVEMVDVADVQDLEILGERYLKDKTFIDYFLHLGRVFFLGGGDHSRMRILGLAFWRVF